KTDSEEIAKIIQPYFEDTELELLTASVERYKQQDSFATSPLLSEDGWNHSQTIMEEAGELPAHAPYNELVDTTIANEVMRQAGGCRIDFLTFHVVSHYYFSE